MLVLGPAFSLRRNPSALYFPSHSILVNLGYFSTLRQRRGDKKCPWLRKLLGKRDVFLYYLKLKGEMNVICHFLGKFSNHKDMCSHALPE